MIDGFRDLAYSIYEIQTFRKIRELKTFPQGIAVDLPTGRLARQFRSFLTRHLFAFHSFSPLLG